MSENPFRPPTGVGTDLGLALLEAALDGKVDLQPSEFRDAMPTLLRLYRFRSERAGALLRRLTRHPDTRVAQDALLALSQNDDRSA